MPNFVSNHSARYVILGTAISRLKKVLRTAYIHIYQYICKHDLEDYSFMKNHFLRWSILTLANTLLLTLLAACSFGAAGGGASTSATPTAGSTPTATPTPSPMPTSLKTFNGNGYSIGYPQGWTEKDNGGQVVFADALGTSTFIVEVAPNPNDIAPIDKALSGSLDTFKATAKNYKDENVAATTTVGGVTWNQKAASGDVGVGGITVNGKIYVLATNHPENTNTTKLYIIVYDAPSATFDQTNTNAFTPMLQSFKFTA